MNEHTISIDELKTLLLHDKDIQLIDVRNEEKHLAYNIGGKLIPNDDLPNQLESLDKDKLIVTYCTSGGRSMHALAYLLSQGFTKVKSLEGGMLAWRAANEDKSA